MFIYNSFIYLYTIKEYNKFITFATNKNIILLKFLKLGIEIEFYLCYNSSVKEIDMKKQFVFNDICWVVGQDKEDKIIVIPTVYEEKNKMMYDLKNAVCFDSDNADLAICHIFEKHNIKPVAHKFDFLRTNSSCNGNTIFKKALYNTKEKMFIYASNMTYKTTSFNADSYYYLKYTKKRVNSENINEIVKAIEYNLNKENINKNYFAFN